jgi:hypothetical protein
VASLGSFLQGSQGKDLPGFRLVPVALLFALLIVLVVVFLAAVRLTVLIVFFVLLVLVQVVVEIILESEAGRGASSEGHDVGSRAGLAFSRFGGG